MDDQQRQREAIAEATRQEMYRKSRDLMRIYNPLEKEFKFKFEGYWNTIGAKQSKDVPRYLARHYFKKMSEYMIGLKQQAVADKILSEKKKGSPADYDKLLRDKYELNRQVYDMVPRLNDQEELKPLRDKLILGLVEEYGAELPDPEEADQVSRPQMTSVEDQMVDEISYRIPQDEVTEVSVE